MMTHDPASSATTTVIESYATEQDAVQAIAALRAAGIGLEAIGVLARHRDEEHAVADLTGAAPIEAAHTGTMTGRLLGSGVGLIAGVAVMILPGMGPLLGVTGLVVTALVGAGIGGVAGGIVGALSAVGIPEHAARHYVERFEAGDIIVVADAGDRSEEVEQILRQGTVAVPVPGA